MILKNLFQLDLIEIVVQIPMSNFVQKLCLDLNLNLNKSENL